jgi:hypothetical protein
MRVHTASCNGVVQPWLIKIWFFTELYNCKERITGSLWWDIPSILWCRSGHEYKIWESLRRRRWTGSDASNFSRIQGWTWGELHVSVCPLLGKYHKYEESFASVPHYTVPRISVEDCHLCSDFVAISILWWDRVAVMLRICNRINDDFVMVFDNGWQIIQIWWTLPSAHCLK